MSTTSRFLGIGAALGLAVGLLVGVGLTQPGRAAATTPTAAPRVASGGGAAVAPVTTTVTSGGSNTATVVSSGPAIAPYPDFAGTPGLAPDHTIVVTGVGQATMPSDGSDQAAAQKSALAAALADAKTQPDAIAADTGLTISGVLSVSASVSPDYGVEPMVANGSSSGSASGEPACIIAVPGSGPSATAGTVAPLPACLPQPIYQQTLSVSVTVEYGIK
ncbi:MAG: SIMPL domain-containing protein [Candidatus Limnocylindrales bacterium]